MKKYSTKTLDDILLKFDYNIKNGNSAVVNKAIKDLNFKLIPRQYLVEFSEIARRIIEPNLIIKMLKSIIYPEVKINPQASNKEILLYAQGLIRLGVFYEAQTLINGVRRTKINDFDKYVYFAQASLHINKWEYDKAIPHLKKYLLSKELSIHQQIVAKINLCASYQALSLYKLSLENIKNLEIKIHQNIPNDKSHLLLSNLSEIKAQSLIGLADYQEALVQLDKAKNYLKNSDSKTHLFIRKWSLIAKYKLLNDTRFYPNFLNELNQLKSDCLNVNEWETIRDIDFHIAVETNNLVYFLKVYWGSKNLSYKNRILRIFQEKYETALNLSHLSYFKWIHNNFSDSISPLQEYDLVDLAPSLKLKKFIFILSREFYRPQTIPELFADMYEKDFYEEKTALARISTLVSSARKWINKCNLPIEIVSIQKGYLLKVKSNCILLLNSKLILESFKIQKNLDEDLKLKKRFTLEEYAKHYRISIRRARERINFLVKANVVKKVSLLAKPTYCIIGTK